MTDREKFTNLLDEWGVPYLEADEDPNTIEIAITYKDHPKLVGYFGFVTCVTFDENGGFEVMGIWE